MKIFNKISLLKNKSYIPTYEEMLEMNEEDMKKWIAYRTQKENISTLLGEMIVHEEVNNSFRKTIAGDLSKIQETLLNVFSRKESSNTVKHLNTIKEILVDGDKEGVDLVMEAIFAKSASDYFKLDKKIEEEGKK